MTEFYENAELMGSLMDQPPRAELIVRMALREEISDLRAIEVWEARIAELELILSPTRDAWDDIYLAAKVQMYRLRYGSASPERLLDGDTIASGTQTSERDLIRDLWL